VAVWRQGLDEEAWQRVDVRDGSKGPLVVEVVTRRVVSRTHRRQQGDEELLVVIRSRDRDNQQVVQVDYYLSNAAPETPQGALARVAKAAHRIEACIQRSKSEAGCVFRAKVATDSTPKLPLIPGESCHRFHGKVATDSIAKLPIIPRQSCH
jgi:hypothetical protein